MTDPAALLRHTRDAHRGLAVSLERRAGAASALHDFAHARRLYHEAKGHRAAADALDAQLAELAAEEGVAP